MKKKKDVLHDYHCFMCGDQLIEDAMGILYCRNCKSFFLPTINNANNPVLEFTYKEQELLNEKKNTII